jgi:hypothetical protein
MGYIYANGSLPTTYSADNFALCFLCHDESKLMSPNSSNAKTNFDSEGYYYINFHRLHLKGSGSTIIAVVLVCRVCHFNVHSNQQTDNTEYVYWPPGGTDWVVSRTPPPGIKTHLINFAPVEVESLNPSLPFPYIDPSRKPRWYINLDNVSHNIPPYSDQIPPNGRACELTCHFDPYYVWMYPGWDYEPGPGDDPPTY